MLKEKGGRLTRTRFSPSVSVAIATAYLQGLERQVLYSKPGPVMRDDKNVQLCNGKCVIGIEELCMDRVERKESPVSVLA